MSDQRHGSDGGVLVVNLLTADTQRETCTARIRKCFDGLVVVMEAEEFGSKVAFACKGGDSPSTATLISERIRDLGPTHTAALRPIAQMVIQKLKQRTPSKPL